MKYWALGLFAALVGCASSPEEQAAKEQRVAQIYHDRCAAMGAVTQDQFFNCRLQMQQADAARSAEYGRRMQTAGAQLLAPQPVPQRRFVNCTTMPASMGTRTTCY